MRAYVRDDLAPSMASALKDVAGQVSNQLAAAIGGQLQEGLGRTFAAAAPQLAQRRAANMQQAFSVDGPCEVTGADFFIPSEFELVNPDQHIACLLYTSRCV